MLPIGLRPAPAVVLVLLAAVFSVAQVPGGEADDQFAVAAGLYARQQWKLAVEQFRVFLSQYPTHPKANEGTFFLAEALLQTGDVQGAGVHFRQYLQREPGGKFARPGLFRAGEAAYLVGKTDLAKTDLEGFRSKYPDDRLNAYVLPYLGDIALGQGDAAAAAGYFRAGLTRFPQGRLQDDCRFGLARALERQNQNEEAARYYLAVAGKPGSPLADDAQFHLGALQYATGQYAQAVETFAAFETRLAASPWKSNARLGHGWSLMKLGRLDDARPVFQGITSDPKVGIEARYWLGMVQRMQEDWSGAAKTLLATAAVAPRHELTSAIRFYAGDALRRRGNWAAAYEQFDLVIASAAGGDGWVDEAIWGKVRTALDAKDYQALDRAAAEFEKRVPQSPLRKDVHRMRSRSLLERKEHAEAAKLLEPLVAAGGSGNSENNDAKARHLEDCYLLAVAYQGLQRYAEALTALSPVLGSAQGRLKADAQLTQGSLLVAMERYAEAVKPLEAFLATGPTGDDAVKGRGELGICYARSGQLDKAKQVYAELLQKHSAHQLIMPATEQLAEAAYEAGDAQWSAELFRRLQTEGNSAEYELKGLAGLGWSQFRAGDLAEAAVTFEQLWKKNVPAAMAVETALVRGRIYEQLNQPDPALAMYDLVIEKYPQTKQHPQALLAAARLRDKLQQDQQAAALYERLAKGYPELPELDAVLYEWAWVLDELDNTAESSELLKRLHKEFSQSRYWSDAAYRLAQRAFAAEDYDRAGELLSEVLAAKSDARIRQHALYLSGQLAVVDEDWDRVRQVFETLLREFPESPRRLVAEYWVAETDYRRRDYEAAGRAFGLLARQTQGRPETWLAMIPLRRAQVLGHQKKWHEAYAIASKIEAEYPNFEQQYEADYLIGRCLFTLARLQQAREAFRRVIRSPTGEKTETAAMAQWMIGETYYHQKNYAAALREYLKVEILYAYPVWQAAALLQAGKCRELLGERKEAAQLYTRLLTVYPNTRFAEEASQRLAALQGQRASPGQ